MMIEKYNIYIQKVLIDRIMLTQFFYKRAFLYRFISFAAFQFLNIYSTQYINNVRRNSTAQLSLYFHEKFDAVWKAFRDSADIGTSLL